jgi:imidazoleglycerol-phosphate dehydratase
MLTLFAKHGLFDLEVKSKGDVDVDYHHTVEDVGLVLGRRSRKRSATRSGSSATASSFCRWTSRSRESSVDVGGRPHLVYEANAPTMFVRDFNLALVKEFCRAFSNALGANLHVQLVYGEEPHHVAEAIFKCLARALDAATQIEPRAAGPAAEHQGENVRGDP